MANEPQNPTKIQDYLRCFQGKKHLWLVGPCELTVHMGAPQEPVVFVDGGVRHREGCIGVTLGDGDSIDYGTPDLLLPAAKDYSDLAYALTLIPESFEVIHMWGFLGGHRDHEIIGFGEVHRFLAKRELPARIDFEGRVLALSKGQWEENMGGGFSLFAFEETHLTLGGACEYRYDGPAPFPALSSHGLSNVGGGLVKVANAKPVFLFRR